MRLWLVVVSLGVHAVGAAAGDDLSMAAAERAVEEGALGRAIELLTERLRAEPDDEAARALRARVASWDGRWDDALKDYRRLLDAAPDNVDYLLGKGQVLLWSGAPAEAADSAARARVLAPDYEAVWRLEVQALLAQQEPAARRAAETLLRDARQRFPQSSWPTPQRESAAVRVAFALDRETLDNGYADWSSNSVRIEHDTARGHGFYGHVRTTERFDLRDREFGAGARLAVSAAWSAWVETTHSPTAEVLPEYSAVAGAERRLRNGWALSFSARHASYTDTHADVLSAGVEKYVGDLRVAYRLSRGRAEGAEATLSHAVRLDRYYGRGSSVGLLLVNGREQESIGAGRIIDTRVRAAALLGEQRLGPAWSFTWTVGRHEQGELYRRDGISVGFRRGT